MHKLLEFMNKHPVAYIATAVVVQLAVLLGFIFVVALMIKAIFF